MLSNTAPVGGQKAIALREEITGKFGFFPPFFEPAMCSFATLDNLWTQTNNSYLDNPLPAVFKEKLAAILGKYCAIPYCLVVHSCTLRPMGLSAADVLKLLETPRFKRSRKALCIERLKAMPSDLAFPEDSDIKTTYLLDAAVCLFNDQHGRDVSRELNRVLGEDTYGNLILFLAYNHMCHRWVEAHPELDYRLDKRAIDNLEELLAAEPTLSGFFKTFDQHAREAQAERENEGLNVELGNLFETIPAAVCVLDEGCKIVRFNKVFRRMFGFKVEDLDQDALAKIARHQLRSTNAREQGSLAVTDRDGKALPLSFASSRIYVESKIFVQVVLLPSS